jgi:hypothetical protein
MNPYLYGVHDPPPFDWLSDHLVRDGQARGWIVFTEALGANPGNHDGRDYRPWSDRGFGVIARLNYGYHPHGTVPQRDLYGEFAARVENYIAASQGCRHWIIGNEMNQPIEWPEEQAIYPADYAQLFGTIRYLVRKLPGHETDLLIPGAIAPWNAELMDWLTYFDHMLEFCQQTGGLDGIALHAYTHGHDPALVTSTQTMDAPYSDRYYEFIHYRQFLTRVPQALRGLPVFVTETNPGANGTPWENIDNGWVQEAYREIDRWNRSGNQAIFLLALYRWQFDLWEIETKDQVHQDLDSAVDFGYTWEDNNLPEWTELLRDGFENGFYDYGGQGELTCPVEWSPDWDEGGDGEFPFVRPEYDAKDANLGHTEVYAGRYSAAFFTVHARHNAVLWRRINVFPGTAVRAQAMTMIESRNNDSSATGGMGCRVGIDPAGGTDFRAEHVIWSEWWSVHRDDFEQREWYQLEVGGDFGAIATSNYVTVFLYQHTDFPADINAGHWDNVEVDGYKEGGTIPPPAGDTHTITVLFDGEVISETEVQCSNSGGNDAQVCALAKQIVGLTCPD